MKDKIFTLATFRCSGVGRAEEAGLEGVLWLNLIAISGAGYGMVWSCAPLRNIPSLDSTGEGALLKLFQLNWTERMCAL